MRFIIQLLAALYAVFGLISVALFLVLNWRGAIGKSERRRLIYGTIVVFAIWPLVATNEIIIATRSKRKEGK